MDDAKLEQMIRIWPEKPLEYLWLRSVVDLNAAGSVRLHEPVGSMVELAGRLAPCPET